MPKKVNKPRLTPNQASWLNEYKKLDDIIKRKRKQGYEIPDDILPSKPQRITQKSIAQLKGIVNEAKQNYTTKATKPLTPKGTKSSTPKGTKPLTPKGTKSSTPKGTKSSTPKGTKSSTPKGTKTLTSKGTKSNKQNQLPQEVDFIDNEIINYLNKAINNIHNSNVNFKYDRIHDLESIIYNINNEFVLPKQEMYKNIHNNAELIKELINVITYDSKQEMVQYAVNEIFNMIFQHALSLEESAKITEQTENWNTDE